MGRATKRIGIVDHELDNFHANTYLSAIRGALAERGYDIVGATATSSAAGRHWAGGKDVRYYESVAELAADVDFFMILAPSDPQMHFSMCEQVLPFGKPTFVDKTFAPSVEVAKSIFALADSYSVPIQTTSALRTTDVQQYVRDCREELQHVYIWGGGGTLEEYGIHPIELAVSCLGANAMEMLWFGPVEHPQIVLRYAEGKSAVIDFTAGAHVEYLAAITTTTATEIIKIDLSKLFIDAAAFVLDFFDAGKPLVNRRETLLVHHALELASRSEQDSARYCLKDITVSPGKLGMFGGFAAVNRSDS